MWHKVAVGELDMTADVEEAVRHAALSYRRTYYAWCFLFYPACVAVIALPIIISSGLVAGSMLKVLAICTALLSGIATWSNLGVVIGNYSKAFTLLETASADFSVSEDKATLVAAYKEAKSLVISWSPGLPKAN